MIKPQKPSEIDFSKLFHSKLKVKKAEKGRPESKQVRITYDKQEMRIRTPLAIVPFGVTLPMEDKEGNSSKFKKYSFEINIDDKCEEFRQAMNTLDRKNIDYIYSQADEWWEKGKYTNASEIEKHVYQKLIKKDKKGEYADRFKMKLPFRDGVPDFKVFDENNKAVLFPSKQLADSSEHPEQVWFPWAKKRMQIEAIVECEGLWVVSEKIYCTFKVLQIRFKSPAQLADNGFLEEDETAVVERPVTSRRGDDDLLAIEDSDEEEIVNGIVIEEDTKAVEELPEEELVEDDVEDDVEVREEEEEEEIVSKKGKKPTKRRG